MPGVFDAPDWFVNAKCNGMNRSIFFVQGRNSWLSTKAKMICLDCPVRLRCLQHGMGEAWGVFGGTSPLDRSRLKRAFKRGIPITTELLKIDKVTRKRAKQLERMAEKQRIAGIAPKQWNDEELVVAVVNLLSEEGSLNVDDICIALEATTQQIGRALRLARLRRLVEPGIAETYKAKE